ncbi:hypothetical protein QEH59_06590 [Coraliomargarita sp. SDUM461004]|uniref:Uncharacterized protein n=1 Tax=Thalassobacterium sedimentorum TaxID=3041258 RepID=A0ABU1AH76_9BACT|nr:hypothetical protein [Coraliomargarita sp. SDUM461004]MDQ8194084.1 hypothetical protein [Coraliomargarita sp. SDUM461004]
MPHDADGVQGAFAIVFQVDFDVEEKMGAIIRRDEGMFRER